MGRARSLRLLPIGVLVAGLVVGATVPGLKVLFIVCALTGAFLILAAFGGGWPSTTTGANQDAMLRGRPYTDATREVTRDAGRRRRV